MVLNPQFLRVRPFDLMYYYDRDGFLEIRLENSCSVSDYAFRIPIQISENRSHAANIYPNPVSDILYIEIDAESVSQSKAPGQTGANAKKVEHVCEVRLYDGLGNLLRQTDTKGGTVQFNVSGLPDGIYYLHIYDGVNDTPDIRQIVVEH